MFNKRIVASICAAVMVLSLAGCSGAKTEAAPAVSADATAPASTEKFVLKLGHIASETQPYHEAAVRFSEKVKERTNGNVEIQVFPGSQLGGQRDLLEGLQLGTVDITLSSSAVLANFIPQCQVMDMPYIFTSNEHVYKVVDGPLADEVYKGAEEKGMKIISTWENGFRQITNNVRPITSPEDMKGIKIRVMENELYIDMFKALGANPTPMAMGELFTALQQKTVDAQDNPVGNTYTSRFYEVQKYMTLDGHTYSPEPVVFSLAVWNKLPEEYQKIILEEAVSARDWNRTRVAEVEAKFLEEMKAKGLEVTELTPEQKLKFQEAMKTVYEKYYDVIGKDLIEKVMTAK